MKRLRFMAASILLAAAFLSPVRANQPVISGQVTHQNIQRLTAQVNWYHSLAQAETDAIRQNKMIFWLHMLGEMDGAT